MSFILDAIKKSERERNRTREQTIHSLQDGQHDLPRSRSRWGSLFAFIIACAVLLVIFWWLLPKINAEFELLPTMIGRVNNAHSKSQTIKESEIVKQQNAVGNHDAEQSTSDRYYRADSELPPRHQIKELWEMPADFQSSVPAMAFSFHVFSQDPAKRTIIINDRRLREGQMVASKLKLRLITSTGVILHYNGRYFHVEVVENW